MKGKRKGMIRRLVRNKFLFRMVMVFLAIGCAIMVIGFVRSLNIRAMLQSLTKFLPSSLSILALVVVATIAFSVRTIRGAIITGILVAIPVFTTIYLVIRVFGFVDTALPKLFGGEWPLGLGIVVLLFAAVALGFAAKNYVGNKIIEAGNALISSIPIFNKIYTGVQQILDTMVSGNKKLFERVVLIEYPKKESWCIAFVTSETTGEIPRRLERKLVSVFVPTTPNPTSGFLLFIPEDEVINLDINVETAIKLVMSAGMVNSDELKGTGDKYKVPEELKGFNWLKNLGKYGKGALMRMDPRD